MGLLAGVAFAALDLCSPARALGQHVPDLVQAALLMPLPWERSDEPPILCVSVTPAGAEGIRDATSAEIPSELRARFLVVGGSECGEYGAGARHIATGREALVVKIGITGVPALGEAELTYGWFRNDRNAGTLWCEARRTGSDWEIGPCMLPRAS